MMLAKDMVRAIIYAGANVDIHANNGKTAKDIGGSLFCGFIHQLELEKKVLVKGVDNTTVTNHSSGGGGGGGSGAHP